MTSQVYLILHDNERVLLAKKRDYPAWFNEPFYGKKPKGMHQFIIQDQIFNFYIGGINFKPIDPNAYVISGGKAKSNNYIEEGFYKFYSETGINLEEVETLNVQQIEFTDGPIKFYAIYVLVSTEIFNLCYELSINKLNNAENFRKNLRKIIDQYKKENFDNIPPVYSNQLRNVYPVEINLIKENNEFFTNKNDWYTRIINYL